MSDEPLWTIQDVAEYLKLNPRTVNNMAKTGKLPARKVAGKWRFIGKDVREYQGDSPALDKEEITLLRSSFPTTFV